MKRVIGSLVWHDSLCPEFMRPKRYEDDPKISLSPKIWSTPFMVSWLPRIHVYPYYTSFGWEIIGVRYQRKIVHTVSQIARNPWSNTERGHLLEANWSNNFEFIQRLAKSLWILKDTEIKSPPLQGYSITIKRFDPGSHQNLWVNWSKNVTRASFWTIMKN